MEVRESRSGEVLILEYSGRLTIGKGDIVVRESIGNAIEQGERNILLDMSGVAVLDSSGVGELVAAHNSAQELDGAVKLLRLTPRVGEVLKITQLTGLFEIFDDRDAALASF